MRLAVFGLTISSSWGNGHATLWRGLCHALQAAGHEVVFFERNVPYYESARDDGPYGCQWILYDSWESIARRAEGALRSCDAAIVTSYCPDAKRASELVLSSAVPMRVFYDLDTPVTLARIEAGDCVEYLPPRGLGDFDLVLSFAGGPALAALRERLGARRVAPLYGSVNVSAYRPVERVSKYGADLSYLGTYSHDRHDTLKALFLDVAKSLPLRSFVLGGALYPAGDPWPENVRRFLHVKPSEHPAFFSSSRLTLSVTREPMVALGYCPSGRLFEAAACQAVIVSDNFDGLSTFFEPGREILVAERAEDVRHAIELGDGELLRIGKAARERVWADHRAEIRAQELIAHLSSPPDGDYRQEPSSRAQPLGR